MPRRIGSFRRSQEERQIIEERIAELESWSAYLNDEHMDSQKSLLYTIRPGAHEWRRDAQDKSVTLGVIPCSLQCPGECGEPLTIKDIRRDDGTALLPDRRVVLECAEGHTVFMDFGSDGEGHATLELLTYADESPFADEEDGRSIHQIEPPRPKRRPPRLRSPDHDSQLDFSGIAREKMGVHLSKKARAAARADARAAARRATLQSLRAEPVIGAEPCACGCGELIPPPMKPSLRRVFLQGHDTRLKSLIFRIKRGEKLTIPAIARKKARWIFFLSLPEYEGVIPVPKKEGVG